MAVSRFNRAVPGQSLTDTPGNHPWEHPPQFNDPKDALDFIYNQAMAPSSTHQILVMLKADIPVEAIVRSLLYTGFTQGKWSPDLIVLLNKPVHQLIIAIGLRAGIKPTVGLPHRYKNKNADMMDKMTQIKAQKDFTTGDIHDEVHDNHPAGVPLIGVLQKLGGK